MPHAVTSTSNSRWWAHIRRRRMAGLVWLPMLGMLAGSALAQPNSTSEVSTLLSGIASAAQLSDLRWPDFSDYRAHVQTFYQPSGYAPAWIRDSRPTPQALAIIDILKQADRQGLDPEDYDGSRWNNRLARLEKPHEGDARRLTRH